MEKGERVMKWGQLRAAGEGCKRVDVRVGARTTVNGKHVSYCEILKGGGDNRDGERECEKQND